MVKQALLQLAIEVKESVDTSATAKGRKRSIVSSEDYVEVASLWVPEFISSAGMKEVRQPYVASMVFGMISFTADGNRDSAGANTTIRESL